MNSINYFFLIMVSLTPTCLLGQVNEVKFHKSQAHSNDHVEIIGDEYFVVEESTSFLVAPRITKVTPDGNRNVVYEEQFVNGFALNKFISIRSSQDSLYVLSMLIGANFTNYIGLVVMDKNFQNAHIKDVFEVTNSFLNYETQDKIWNKYHNRFEWILALRSEDSAPVTEIINCFFEGDSLIVRTLPYFNDNGGFFHAIINEESHQYAVSTGNDIILLDSNFENPAFYSGAVKYDNVTYLQNNFILSSLDGNELNFFVRRLGMINYFNLNQIKGIIDIEEDTIINEVIDFDILENNASVYAVFQNENDFDDTRFLIWSENTIVNAPLEEKKIVVKQIEKGSIEFSKTIEVPGIQGVIRDIEYKDGIYFGCGRVINLTNSDNQSFFFFFDEQSEFITSTHELSEESNEFKIYPNPSDGIINISHDIECYNRLLIYDYSGAIVQEYSTGIEKVNLEGLSGMFAFVLMCDNKIISTQKILLVQK